MFLLFSSKTFSNHRASGCPYECLLSGTAGSFFLSHDFGHRDRGRRMHMTGDSDSGFRNNCGASFIFTSSTWTDKNSFADKAQTRFKHHLVLFDYCFIRFAFTLSASQIYVIKKWVWFVKMNVSPSISSTWEPDSASVQAFWCHPHVSDRNTLVSIERTYIPSSGLSPIQVLIKLARIVFPITIRLMDDHINFVQEVPRDLQFSSMILAICVVKDVAKHLDILILDPILPEHWQTLHHLLFLRILEVWKSHPEHWRLKCVTRRIPARWKLHTNRSHLPQRRHVVQHVLLCMFERVAQSEFFFFFESGASPWALQNELWCLLSVPARSPLACCWLGSCHADKFFNFSNYFQTAPRIWTLHCLGHWNRFVHKIIMTRIIVPSSAM